MSGRSTLATLVSAAMMLGCGGYSIDLPNEYRLIRSSAYRAAIADPQNTIVVHPNVVAYAVIGDVVVGRGEVPEVIEGQPDPHRRGPGYFVIDTSTRAVADDLSSEEWIAELKKHGIERAPDLKTPTAFD